MARFNIIEQLRAEIRKCGMTEADVAAKANYQRPNLIKFMSGERKGMELASFARICRVLGLELHKPERDSNK